MLVTSSSAPLFRLANGKVRWPEYFFTLVYLEGYETLNYWNEHFHDALSVLIIAVSTQRQQHNDTDRAAGSLSPHHDDDLHLISSSLEHLLFSAMREELDSLFSSNYVSMNHCFKWFLTRKDSFKGQFRHYLVAFKRSTPAAATGMGNLTTACIRL